MRIENGTDYDGRFLRSLLCGVHRWLAKTEGRLPQWRRVRFEIRYTRTAPGSGHAYLRGTYALLRIPRPDAEVRAGIWRGSKYEWEGDGYRGARVENLVGLAWHEMLHLYGYRHSAMARHYPDETESRAICESLGLGPKGTVPLRPSLRPEETPEPVEALTPLAGARGALLAALAARRDDLRGEADRYEAKLRAALAKRKEWTTKARRAKTFLARYRSKENRARRKLQDLGLDPEAIAADELGDYEPAMAGDLKV